MMNKLLTFEKKRVPLQGKIRINIRKAKYSTVFASRTNEGNYGS